jgi:hypothetical protein
VQRAQRRLRRGADRHDQERSDSDQPQRLRGVQPALGRTARVGAVEAQAGVLELRGVHCRRRNQAASLRFRPVHGSRPMNV